MAERSAGSCWHDRFDAALVGLQWARLALVLPFLLALAFLDTWKYPKAKRERTPRDHPAGPVGGAGDPAPVEELPQPRLRLVR